MSYKINDGGPAFPQIDNSGQNGEGMSLRDWFAGQALAGISAHPDMGGHPAKAQADWAYDCADAMLDRRTTQ